MLSLEQFGTLGQRRLQSWLSTHGIKLGMMECWHLVIHPRQYIVAFTAFSKIKKTTHSSILVAAAIMPPSAVDLFRFLAALIAPIAALPTLEDEVFVAPSADFVMLQTRSQELPLVSRQVTETVENPTQIGYGVDMAIGGTTFHLLLDTGSPLTWVTPSQYTCTNVADSTSCTVGKTHLKVTADELASPDEFFIGYGENTNVSGVFVDRPLTLAPGLTAAHQAIGAATEIRQTRDLDRGWMDGLLGLGPWKATEPYSSPFFTVLSSLKVKQFGIALFGDIDTNSSPPNTGLLSFGGYPSALTLTSPDWAVCPLLTDPPNNQWYTIHTDSYLLNSKTFRDPQNYPVIVDSGTTLTFLPSSITNALFLLLPGTGTDPEKQCTASSPATEKCLLPSGVWRVPCDGKMPTFSVVLGGTAFAFHPDNLNMEFPRGSKQCVSGVGPMQAGMPHGTLGVSFWKNDVVVVHDWTEGRPPRLLFGTYADPE